MGQINEFFAPSIKRIREALSLSGKECISSPKDHTRTMLAGGVILTVPVAGGNSMFKRRDTDMSRIMISQHGDWQHQHIGTWQALYGKSPYFIHLFPMIHDVYSNHSSGSFLEFNRALYAVADEFLELDAIRDATQRLNIENPGLLADMRNEVLSQCDENMTVFDPIFRMGKDAAYLFI